MAKPGYANQSFWFRLIFMLFYWCVLNVAITVFGILVVVVSVVRLFTRSEPMTLSAWLRSLGVFMLQIIDFLAFNQEEKPFPFQPWPKGDKNEQ
ncbi:DUF4389 domain-containing protein [Marinomonas pollencensis]|uniref:Uncharacterized protein DUF4389 n=1 Tax=Marinomonas pollencensis TaxID=491954 RepID=A0A3E0DTG9_9GAMM|nr:DUF4389 domain-containing protein [Marinomonas pollencensis]REG85796.1 uncharacterized protein DUF4389 [Marinomonas pollencensis]